MPRWLWWAPLGLLLVGCGLFGWRYGWIAARITETDVITRYAERYLQEQGGSAALSDCVAVPDVDLPGIWLVVRCTPRDMQQSYEYYVNRFGGFEYGAPSGSAPLQEPRT